VASGTSGTFTIMPNSGYRISSVSGTCGGTLSEETNTYITKAITGNCTVSASFTKATTYTVSVDAGIGGTISPSGYITATSGTRKTFTITPDPGYRVSSIGGCGIPSGDDTYMTCTTSPITANLMVTATFTKQ
jgi:hypothetical protein